MTRASIASLILIALSATACGTTFAPSAATVGDHEIALSALDSATEEFQDSDGFATATEGQDELEALRTYEQSYLSLLIRIAVFEPHAEALGITVSDEDVEGRENDIRSQFPDEAAFQEALGGQGLTLPELRLRIYQDELEGRLRSEVTADDLPDDAELRAHYEANIEAFTEVRSSHILVEDNVTAIEISDQLAATPTDQVPDEFAKLARRFSIDEGSGARGGDLGFSNYGEFVEPFSNALIRLEVGEVSTPVRTEFGFHIIYLADRRVRPFEEVKDQIVSEVAGQAQEDAWRAWVIAAYEDAEVTVNPRFGEFDLETQTVADATPDQIPGAATPKPTPSLDPTAAPSPLG